MKNKKLVLIAVLSVAFYFAALLIGMLIIMSESAAKERCADFGLVVKTTGFDVKSMVIRTKCERGLI